MTQSCSSFDEVLMHDDKKDQKELGQKQVALSTNDGPVRLRAGRPQNTSRGFTIYEVVLVCASTLILSAVAIPSFNRSMANMKLNSMASGIAGVISQTRYNAIMNSQIYTLVFTVPANTYTVNNVSAGTSGSTIPLPSQLIAINGGAGATYTFTLCPNGTVFGAGGTCIGNNNLPPALSVAYQGRQINISVSGVGNVTTTTVN
jgi:hypothetical protein